MLNQSLFQESGNHFDWLRESANEESLKVERIKNTVELQRTETLVINLDTLLRTLRFICMVCALKHFSVQNGTFN